MVDEVIKRNGAKVQFDKSKITSAISNVFSEFGIKNIELAENLTDKVLKRIEDGDTPHVEQIQDIVEDVLIAEDYVEEAKAYIKYRADHEKRRKEWIKNELPLSVWTRKYQFEGENFTKFLDRVSPNPIIKRFIKQKKFSFAGRILANRKLSQYGINVTYSNCYVTTPPKDNLESINEATYKLERTFSYGGLSKATL